MTVELPLRCDGLSGWQLAPRTAWESGDGGLVRCFDTAEAALGKIDPLMAAFDAAELMATNPGGAVDVEAMVA